MENPFIGEIRMFGGSFPPSGWAFCDGQPMAISQNDVLFQLIGTTYGGDGQQTFNLPDLRGRLPMHMGGGFIIGQNGGQEQVTLTAQQIPIHTHPPVASNNTGDAVSPENTIWAAQGGLNQFVSNAAAASTVTMAANTVGTAGGSQPHDNMMPYAVINFIISLFGLFPTPN